MSLSKKMWIVGSLLLASGSFYLASIPFFIVGLVFFFNKSDSTTEDFYFNLFGIITYCLMILYVLINFVENFS